MKTEEGFFSPFIDAVDAESGATAIEYGLMAFLIAVAIIVAVTTTGTSLSNFFTFVAGEVSAAIGGAL